MNKKFIALVSSIAFALAPATPILAEDGVQGDVSGDQPTSATTPSAEPTAHTVHYETNGGTPIKDRGGALGKGYDTFRLSDYKTEKEGYTFDGWYYDKDFTQPAEDYLSVVNDSRGILYFEKDVTVYAKWTKNDEKPAETTQPAANPSTNPNDYVPSAENHSGVSYGNPEYVGVFHDKTVSSNTDVKSDNKAFAGAFQLGLKKSTVEDIIKQFNLDGKKIVDAFELYDDDMEGAAYKVTFTNKALYKDGHVYKVRHYHWDGKTQKYVEKETPTATAKNGSITVTLHGASPVLIEDLGAAKTAETKVSKNGRKAALKTGVEY